MMNTLSNKRRREHDKEQSDEEKMTKKKHAEVTKALTKWQALKRRCDEAERKFHAKLAEYEQLPGIKEAREKQAEKEAVNEDVAVWQRLIQVIESEGGGDVKEEVAWLREQGNAALELGGAMFCRGGPGRPKVTESRKEGDFGFSTDLYTLTYELFALDPVTVEWEDCDVSDDTPEITDKGTDTSLDPALVRLAMDRKNSWTHVLAKVANAQFHLALLFVRFADALFVEW